MTQQKGHLPAILGAAAVGTFAAGAFLLPAGEGITHLLFITGLGGAASALLAYAYALSQPEPVADYDESLHPAVQWYTIDGDRVPAALLDGGAPLVALVREGDVPHPEFAALLVPYFADLSLAFVQGAVQFEGQGGVAEAFGLQRAIAGALSTARNATNAAPLWGNGAILSREALREAYRPGDTWATLGMRMQSMGYTGRFEPEAMVLAYAPQTLSQYGGWLAARTRTTLGAAMGAVAAPGLPLAARLQYGAAGALCAGAWAAAAMVPLSILALFVRGYGPVVATSPGAMLGDALFVAFAVLSIYLLQKFTAVNPFYPAVLAMAGAGAWSLDQAHAAWASPATQRARGAVAAAARGAWATVRAGGSGGTAPAGTPARS